MTQNYLAITQLLSLLLLFSFWVSFLKLTIFGDGTQLTYSCHTFSIFSMFFVPKYDYFFP